jgi:hypothetical protein
MKSKPTPKELGFSPQYKEMDEDQAEMYMSVLLSQTKEIPKDDIPFPIQIIDKRIEAMNLPISFTGKAKILALILTDGNPGRMVTVLIDALIEHEGEEVDHEKLSLLYPMGFYSDTSFDIYVNDFLKEGKSKWSEIY